MKKTAPGKLLTKQDRALLRKVADLLEDINENLEILGDEETMKSLAEAEEDVKAGRTRPWEEVEAELRKAGRLQG